MTTKGTNGVVTWMARRLTECGLIEWRSLRTHAGIYQSRGWYAVSEDVAPESTYYLCARDTFGHGLGIVPAYLFAESAALGLYCPTATLSPAIAAKLAGQGGAALVLGSRAGYLTGWSIVRDEAKQANILREIILAAVDFAERQKVATWSAQYLPASEADLLAMSGLVDRDEFCLQTMSAVVELDGRGFDHYVAGLKSSRRSIVKRDLATFAGSGCRLERRRLVDVLDFAPGLLRKVQQRHGSNVLDDTLRQMLETQMRHLDASSLVVVARSSSDAPLAYSLSYVSEQTLYVRLVGMNHDLAEQCAAYFVTAYYEPIRVAYELGLQRVHLGIGSLRPKVLRGARLEPLYAVFRGRDGWRMSHRECVRMEDEIRRNVELSLRGG